MSLKEKVQSFKKEGIAFMEGREKGDLKSLFDKVVTIENYDFITDGESDYLVFIIKEDVQNFYFGGKVLTDNFKQFTDEEKNEIIETGLPVQLKNKKGKKYNYTAIEYFPM